MTVLTDICRAPDDDSKACPEQEPALSLSNAEGSKSPTASRQAKCSSTDSWAPTPHLSKTWSAPNADESGRLTQVHTITLSPIERFRLDVR